MNTISENEVYQAQFNEEVAMKFVENTGESPVLMNLLFHCMHRIFIDHRWSSALQIIMHIFVSIKVSNPYPYH
jgi:hypothetical protein